MSLVRHASARAVKKSSPWSNVTPIIRPGVRSWLRMLDLPLPAGGRPRPPGGICAAASSDGAKKNSPDPAVRKSVAGRRPTGPATRSRIRATLRKAFNDALRHGIIPGVANPAALVRTSPPGPADRLGIRTRRTLAIHRRRPRPRHGLDRRTTRRLPRLRRRASTQPPPDAAPHGLPGHPPR